VKINEGRVSKELPEISEMLVVDRFGGPCGIVSDVRNDSIRTVDRYIEFERGRRRFADNRSKREAFDIVSESGE